MAVFMKSNLIFLGILQVATYPFGQTIEEQFSNGTLKLRCTGECQRSLEVGCIMDKVDYKAENYLELVDCFMVYDLRYCLNRTRSEVTYNFVQNCSKVKNFAKLHLNILILSFYNLYSHNLKFVGTDHRYNIGG